MTSSVIDGRERRRRVVLLLCVLAVLGFYLRCAWSYDKQLDPARGRTDFQNLQADAFLAGQLHLDVQVPDGLLQLPDPYDPVANAPYQSAANLHDLSLYKGKLYTYFGPTPVVLLYIPYRLLRVGDLSPTLACLLFCIGGFLASVGALRVLTRRFLQPLSITTEAIAVLALGLAGPMGWLISIGRGYEVAIACGYCMVSAGLLFLSLGLFGAPGRPVLWLALGSLCMAAAIGARPNLFFGLAFIALALAYVWFGPGVGTSRGAPSAALLVPTAVVGVVLVSYNLARFGQVSEFGTSYMLLGENVRLARADELGFLGRGLFDYLLAPFSSRSDFPWLALRPVSSPTPSELSYLEEPVVGLLPSMPAALLGIAVFAAQPWRRLRSSGWLGVLIAALTAVPLLIMALTSFHQHGATMRYQVDWTPMLLLASVLGWLTFSQRSNPRPTALRVVQAVALAVVAWSIFFSIAITAYPCAGTGSC